MLESAIIKAKGDSTLNKTDETPEFTFKQRDDYLGLGKDNSMAPPSTYRASVVAVVIVLRIA